MVVADRIHDDMRTGSAVVDVADDVQRVNCQTLYQLAHGNDEIVGAAGVYDCGYNLVEVGVFIWIGLCFVQQFLDYVAEILRQGFVDFRAGVF